MSVSEAKKYCLEHLANENAPTVLHNSCVRRALELLNKAAKASSLFGGRRPRITLRSLEGLCPASVYAFDTTARTIAGEYPELFAGHQSDPDERLWDLLTQGLQPLLTRRDFNMARWWWEQWGVLPGEEPT